MATTEFLSFFQNAPAGTQVNIGTSTERGGIDSIAGTNDFISSGTSSSYIERTSKILEEQNRLLSLSSQQGIIKNLDLASQNLVDLGIASKNISEALNTNIQIREEQREADLNFALQLQDQINETNERLSGQVQAIGQSIESQNQEKQTKGFFDGFSLPTFNDIKIPLLIGGAALIGLFGVKRLLK